MDATVVVLPNTLELVVVLLVVVAVLTPNDAEDVTAAVSGFVVVGAVAAGVEPKILEVGGAVLLLKAAVIEDVDEANAPKFKGVGAVLRSPDKLKIKILRVIIIILYCLICG